MQAARSSRVLTRRLGAVYCHTQPPSLLFLNPQLSPHPYHQTHQSDANSTGCFFAIYICCCVRTHTRTRTPLATLAARRNTPLARHHRSIAWHTTRPTTTCADTPPPPPPPATSPPRPRSLTLSRKRRARPSWMAANGTRSSPTTTSPTNTSPTTSRRTTTTTTTSPIPTTPTTTTNKRPTSRRRRRTSRAGKCASCRWTAAASAATRRSSSWAS